MTENQCEHIYLPTTWDPTDLFYKSNFQGFCTLASKDKDLETRQANGIRYCCTVSLENQHNCPLIAEYALRPKKCPNIPEDIQALEDASKNMIKKGLERIQ